MPLITINGLTCYYRLDGPDEAPVLMLAHALGLDHGMWDQQARDLQPHFRILRYDIRGHGASGAPSGDYTIEQLGHDALGLAAALDIDRFAFCGISIGGMVAQWLGVHAPDRLTHLVIANSSPRPDGAGMETRRRTVLRDGIAAIREMAVGRWFSRSLIDANPPHVASACRTLAATDAVGYAGCCAAIRDMDMLTEVSGIHVPTLVICGDADVAMPWDGHSAVLAAAIPGARAVHLPAAHLSNLETPRSFSAALLAFLLPAPETREHTNAPDRLQVGFAVRRSVLGDAHVDRAIASTSDFTRAFQELITQYAWGSIWTRPGLDHHTRRLLVLAMTASLGRWEEFCLHVRAGLAHDLEPCDLEEVLLQVAIYAGVPTANAAFHHATAEMATRADAYRPR
jgi:3-oxoadipate enol-lactonase / 4-carboxymuconolactone decarboxylase